tara:strand:+ start:17174 stop:17626 length:453 start_codon:yes stop_codon:yes gene_type:complete
MSEKVYYLKFNEVSDPTIEEYIEEEMLNLFMSLMTRQECFNKVVFVPDESSVFLFIEEGIKDRIIKYSKSIGIFKSIDEISDDILFRIFNGENSQHKEIFKKTFQSTNEHTHILEKYISDNLTSDVVLDRINYCGIGSLTKTDYGVLESV